MATTLSLPRSLRPLLALGVVGVMATCTPANTEDTALARGDVAFSRDSLEEALAEYRLAVRQGRDDPATLARVAHTYVELGQVDEARDFYRRASRLAPEMHDQAASDFVHLARAAAERRDRFQMASAMDAALEFVPGLQVQEMALPLARHYFEAGEYGRALPFYHKALAATADSVPELVFEVGQAYEEIGDCQRGLVFFERFREMVRPWERGEVDWYIGNCAFRMARERRLLARRQEREARAARASAPVTADSASLPGYQEEELEDPLPPTPTGPDGAPLSRTELLEDALRLVDRTIEVGEPRNIQSQAHFEKGEILAALGDCEGAMEAFSAVRWAEPTPSTPLARRARERYDEIRFGRGLSEFSSSGRCG